MLESNRLEAEEMATDGIDDWRNPEGFTGTLLDAVEAEWGVVDVG